MQGSWANPGRDVVAGQGADFTTGIRAWRAGSCIWVKANVRPLRNPNRFFAIAFRPAAERTFGGG